MRLASAFALALACVAASAQAQSITAAGQPAQLDIRAAGDRSIRVTLKPVSFKDDFPAHPAIVERKYPAPALSMRELSRPRRVRVGALNVDVRPSPLTLIVTNSSGQAVQEIVFEEDGSLAFKIDEQPVLGMGEGGPRPQKGENWRQQPVQFDRRGALDTMEPRWQSDMYGSRNPVAMLLGTAGWGLFVADAVGPGRSARREARRVPAVEADRQRERAADRAQPAAGAGQGHSAGRQIVPGLYDFFVFDAHDPAAALKDFCRITGPAVMPPKWALGLHAVASDARGREADARDHRHVPVEADSGRCRHLSRHRLRAARLEHQAAVVRLQPRCLQARSGCRARGHARAQRQGRRAHGAVGSRQAADAARLDSAGAGRRRSTRRTSRATGSSTSPLVHAGIDAFWPDEGDWFNLFERIKRHQLYYQGHLSTTPNVRPWSLQRNGYPGHRAVGRLGVVGRHRDPRGRRSRRRSPSASTTR